MDILVEKTTSVEAALFLIENRLPDVILIDANHLPAETTYLLGQARAIKPEITQVVMDGAILHHQHFRQAGADFVIDDRDLDHQFTQILLGIQNQWSEGAPD